MPVGKVPRFDVDSFGGYYHESCRSLPDGRVNGYRKGQPLPFGITCDITPKTICITKPMDQALPIIKRYPDQDLIF